MSVDYSWIQQLPKISLHDHLDGGVQLATLLELAQQAGYELPAHNLEDLEKWFVQTSTATSWATYLTAFEHTVALMQSAENLQRVAREHVLALAADGVVYGEVRWAPEKHTGGGLSMEEAVLAVVDGLQEGMAEVAQAGGRVLVNQILCAMRQSDRSLEVAQLAVKHRRIGVVGFDLAGPETDYLPSKHKEALDYLAEHFMPVTLHAGETAGLESIRDALLTGRALRLGQGVRITDDFSYTSVGEIDPDGTLMPGADPAQPILQLGEVASWIKDRRITLEVCPSSNLHRQVAPAVRQGKICTGEVAKSIAEHPLSALREAGFSVAISPDNRLMDQTSITSEMVELARAFGYGPSDFFELTVNAVEGAFISVDEKQLLLRSIQGPYMQAMQQLATQES